MRVTRQTLIDDLSDQHPHVSKKELDSILNDLLEDIMYSVSDGDYVTINGFGRFEPIYLKPRLARNVAEKKMIDVPGRMAAKFRPGRTFRQLVNSR